MAPRSGCFPRKVWRWEGGIVIGCPAPSPGEKHLLYAVVDAAGGDLLMINGPRKR